MAAVLPSIVIQPQRGWKIFDWHELGEYRDLLYFMVLRDITVVYKQTILGFSWALLNPFLNMIVFTVIFGTMAKVPSDGIPKPIFYYSALLPWTYFAAALTGSTNSLIQGTNLFTKVYFPRVFIPLVPVVSKLVDFFIAALLLGALMVFYHVSPSVNMVFLPLPLVILVLTASGAGLWLSALAIQFRDVRHAMTFGIQLLMYAAPVVWPVSLISKVVPAHADIVRLLYGFYPMAGVIEGFRSAVLGKTPMPWDLIGPAFLGAILVFISGASYFRRTERIFADVA
jgi:lipopolysaccharide transport system permease protein